MKPCAHFRHSSLGPQAATPKNFEAHSKNLDAYSKNLEAQSKNFEAQPKNLEAQPKNLEAQSGPGRRNQPPRTKNYVAQPKNLEARPQNLEAQLQNNLGEVLFLKGWSNTPDQRSADYGKRWRRNVSRRAFDVGRQMPTPFRLQQRVQGRTH